MFIPPGVPEGSPPPYPVYPPLNVKSSSHSRDVSVQLYPEGVVIIAVCFVVGMPGVYFIRRTRRSAKIEEDGMLLMNTESHNSKGKQLMPLDPGSPGSIASPSNMQIVPAHSP